MRAEAVESGQASSSRHSEHRALIIRTAGKGRAVEISIRALHKRSRGISGISAIGSVETRKSCNLRKRRSRQDGKQQERAGGELQQWCGRHRRRILLWSRRAVKMKDSAGELDRETASLAVSRSLKYERYGNTLNGTLLFSVPLDVVTVIVPVVAPVGTCAFR